MKTVCALAVAALVAGCASVSSIPSDPGVYPSNHLQQFALYLAGSLKDPYSAQVKHFAGPAPYSRAAGLFVPALSGWGACYTVNAKNSFGGYTGAKWYLAIFRDGVLFDLVIDEPRTDIFTLAGMSRFCNSAGSPNANAHSLAPASAALAATPSTEPPQLPTPAVVQLPSPALNPPSNVVVPSGKDAYVAERLARELKCSHSTPSKLVGKGAGYESYSMDCTNGETLLIRCEMGNCRALR